MPVAARTAVVSLLAAAAALLPGSPAAAAAGDPTLPPGAGESCRIHAAPPDALGTFYTTASGDFICATPRDMSLTVCLEILNGVDLVQPTEPMWAPDGCEGTSAYGTYLAVEAIGCELGFNVYRTVAVGSASGRTYRAESAPVVFYCSPL